MASHEARIGRTLKPARVTRCPGSESNQVQKTRNGSAQFSFCFTTRSAGGRFERTERESNSKTFSLLRKQTAQANGGIAQLVER